MKKRIISIILIIAVSIPMFRVHTVKSSAFDPTIISDLLRAIGLVTAGAVAGGAAMGLGDCLAEVIDVGVDTWYNETLPNKVTTAANNVLNNDGVIVSNTGTGYYVSVNNSLTGDDLEYATILADKLNSHYDLDFLITSISNSTGGISGYSLQRTSYEELKTIIGQATAEFTQQKALEYAKQSGKELTDLGALPVYNFNFVGPMQPGLELPTMATTSTTFLKDGFVLGRPYAWTNLSYYPKSLLISLGFEVYNESGDNAMGRLQLSGVTARERYFVYNNDVFYAPCNKGDYSGYFYAHSFFSGDLKKYINKDGVTLEAAGATKFKGLLTGYYYTYNDDVSKPSITADDLSDNNFTIPITPGSVEIPRTADEQAITDGINLGLISSNPDIELDENGNIVKIDGIDTAKLMDLLQTIANNGTISFDSIEQYLQAITALISAGNTDTRTMQTVLNNLKELTNEQNKSISEINTAVQSIAQALEISDTATADNTFDIDTPSTIIDKFPFCLPFDIQRVFNLLSAEPKAPSYDIPITMEGVFDYHITGDLSEYEWLAGIVRWVLYIVFVIGLIMITNKLIGRG